jgi:hypothetical protein
VEYAREDRNVRKDTTRRRRGIERETGRDRRRENDQTRTRGGVRHNWFNVPGRLFAEQFSVQFFILMYVV